LLIFTYNRLIGPPSDWTSSQRFVNADKHSIYGKLYNNKMNGLKSFYTLEDGLKHMIGKKVALFQVDSSNLYSLVNGECKVQNSIFVHTLIKLLKIVQ
jgi:hypothetical protein